MNAEQYQNSLLSLTEARRRGKVDERNYVRGLMLLEEHGHNPCKDVKDAFKAGRTLWHLTSVN